MKRFYSLASYTKNEDGYAIQLDGKSVKTPLGQTLVSPNKPLADEIVKEWSAQEEKVNPRLIPMTQMLTTAIDRMRDRDALTKTVLSYLDTDLLCYRVKEPAELSKRQKEVWDRWLTWFDENFESPLEVTFGIEALKQDADTHKQIWNYIIKSLDDFYFTVLQVLTALTGSIVLALAFIEGEANADDVFNAEELEEIYHAELAGEDIHGADPVQERRQNNLRRELISCRRFMDFLDAA